MAETENFKRKPENPAEEKFPEAGRPIMIADKHAMHYVFSLMKALQPQNYEETGSITIQVAEIYFPNAAYVIDLFKNLGIVEEESRKMKDIWIQKEGGQGYPLKVVEIVLVKHPKFRH